MRTLLALTTALLLIVAPSPVHGAQGPGTESPGAAPAQTETADPLARIAFIGASVTAGYGNSGEMQTGRNVPLSTFFRCTLAGEQSQAKISEFGSGFFFQAPHARGAHQVTRALGENPTLVVGVDFLFWYAFGYSSRKEPRRAAGLTAGLKELERFRCPLIIGDLPSIEHAMAGKGPFGGPIVQRGQFPSEDERAAMNLEIRAWAEARDHVELIALSELMGNMVQGRTITIGKNSWEEPKLSNALQEDLLHPKAKGSIWTALFVAEAALALEGVERTSFLWGEAEVKEALDRATHDQRTKYLERARKAAERKEKLAERRRARELEGAGGKKKSPR